MKRTFCVDNAHVCLAMLCLLAAAPMAWLVSRTDLPAKRLMRALILASFVTPPFLGAFAWVLLGGPNAGLINQWYYALLGLKPFEATPLINIFSASGMVFVMALYTFPYVFTFAANALDAVPSELEEASAILGAPAWRTALHVTLPLVLPALLGGFIVAFLQSMTLFGTPAILALPAGIDTMTTKIWSLFQFPPQLGLAAAASLPLYTLLPAVMDGVTSRLAMFAAVESVGAGPYFATTTNTRCVTGSSPMFRPPCAVTTF
jgi:iron(III) transport system permease protein